MIRAGSTEICRYCVRHLRIVKGNHIPTWEQGVIPIKFPDVVNKKVYKPKVVMQDERGRLHCDDGPALVLQDGSEFYFVHGIVVPEEVIKAPHLITIRDIFQTRNQSRRRILIERKGLMSILCHRAVAWTFGMTPDEYSPRIET